MRLDEWVPKSQGRCQKRIKFSVLPSVKGSKMPVGLKICNNLIHTCDAFFRPSESFLLATHYQLESFEKAQCVEWFFAHVSCVEWFFVGFLWRLLWLCSLYLTPFAHAYAARAGSVLPFCLWEALDSRVNRICWTYFIRKGLSLTTWSPKAIVRSVRPRSPFLPSAPQHIQSMESFSPTPTSD